jgi:hypothetical protein
MLILSINIQHHCRGDRALEFENFGAIRTRRNATRLAVAGELNVSLLNRDPCNETLFSPKGIHKSAQGCGPAATLGQQYSHLPIP